MRSNDANGQKKAPTRGSRDGNTHARRAAAHPNVHLTPRTAGQLPTWGQALVHAPVRAQFGLKPQRHRLPRISAPLGRGRTGARIRKAEAWLLQAKVLYTKRIFSMVPKNAN